MGGDVDGKWSLSPLSRLRLHSVIRSTSHFQSAVRHSSSFQRNYVLPPEMIHQPKLSPGIHACFWFSFDVCSAHQVCQPNLIAKMLYEIGLRHFDSLLYNLWAFISEGRPTFMALFIVNFAQRTTIVCLQSKCRIVTVLCVQARIVW